MQNFNQIYNENYRWVVRLIKNKTNNAVECEEMANDIFMKINENLANFDATKCSSGLRGWITSFVYNKTIDYYRKKKMDCSSISSFMDDEGREIFNYKSSDSIENDYCKKELINNVKTIIDNLPKTYRTIAKLFYVDDYSYDEIVEVTGLSLGTVKGQLNRARLLIKTTYGK